MNTKVTYTLIVAAGMIGTIVSIGSNASAQDFGSPIGSYYDTMTCSHCTSCGGGSCDGGSDCWTDQCCGAYDGCCGDSCCGDSCCGNSCCCGGGLLGGLIKPSDTCFSDFISPMTNPVFFEDPRTLTELRFIFLTHDLPTGLGGDVQLLAMQIRAALTDRLSIVAAKDGFVWADAGAPLDDGWADVALGLKYNLHSNPCAGTILSTGFSYEMPVGSTRALQGNGDGEFHLYLTGGKRIGCNSHWLSASGFRLPVDSTDETQVWYWSNHADTYLGCGFYGLAEVNWYHWMKSGGQAPFNGLVGVDLFNFGGTGVAGTDVVTGALGVKYKPDEFYEVGLAYETHLTDERGVLENRITVDFIVRY